MALRLSHLPLLISVVSLFFDASYAGRYIYDKATGEFEKKSKKQLYRLKVVDKAKPAPQKKYQLMIRKNPAIHDGHHFTNSTTRS